MQIIEPTIVYQTPYGKSGLYKVIVEYHNINKENYPYPLKTEFITKQLKFVNNSNAYIKLNPILCEAFINKNFKSPYLNVAEYVTIQNGVIVLFFNEASGDFHGVKRNNYQTVKGWLKSLVRAIVHLHLHRIMHGDIKAANLLIFDSIAKLSDFGSSAVILGDGNQKFINKSFTPTHRAPEVWKSNQWGLSADIWALGCTVYEMIYGVPLFQVKTTDDDYIRQINAWCDPKMNYGENIEFHKDWNNPLYADINMLILKMLNPDPFNRPTIFDIVKESFFQSEIITRAGSPINGCSYNELSICPIIAQRVYTRRSFNDNHELNKIYNIINQYESDKEIKMLVICMYESFNDSNVPLRELLKSLVIIVHLLVHRGVPPIFTLTRNDISNILIYSAKIKFNYVNWDKFYGIYEKFQY